MSWACSSLRKEHGELLEEVPSELGVGAAAAAGGQVGCHQQAALGEISRDPAWSLWQEILTWMLQTQAVGLVSSSVFPLSRSVGNK